MNLYTLRVAEVYINGDIFEKMSSSNITFEIQFSLIQLLRYSNADKMTYNLCQKQGLGCNKTIHSSPFQSLL